ncbi:MAG: hypothetical protein WDO24_04455 [Pseudomonadota bacterium]
MVTDEEVSDRLSPTPNAFLWIVDITEETKPIPIATFRCRMICRSPVLLFGAHQPMEQVHGDVLFVTWFAGGLRAVDISDPYAPKEVGSLHAAARQGPQHRAEQRTCSSTRAPV